MDGRTMDERVVLLMKLKIKEEKKRNQNKINEG